MDKQQYQAQGLHTFFIKLQAQNSTGTLHLNAELHSGSRQKSYIFTWKKGEVTYGGSVIPNQQDFAKALGQKLKRDIINVAIDTVTPKLANPTSTRELVEKLVQVRVLTWEQVETTVQNQVIWTLEQVLPYQGQAWFDPSVKFDLTYGEDRHGLDWTALMTEVERRQSQWTGLAPQIPSIHAIPKLQTGSLSKITESAIREHLQTFVDGQRSLAEIADALGKDPLSIAQSYLKWVQVGWIRFQETPVVVNAADLPAILAVDDSPIVQTSIKRALAKSYNVLLASSAKEALLLLTQKKVELLITDVTMPEVDGLELCRTIRSMPQFKHLPVIMLTARDGMVDKLKGQIAGSTKYLTKPFEPEKLLEVVREYA